MTGISNISKIAISGLNDAAERVANAASNIVNASSIAPLPQKPENYTGFTPQDVVSVSVAQDGNNLGVTTATVPRNPAYVTVPDASSPLANAQGLVAAPNVDLASELVTAKVASVNYGANAAVLKIEQKLQKSLLDIKT